MSTQSLTTRFLANPGAPPPANGRLRAAPFRRQRKPRAGGLWTTVVAAYRRHRTRAVLAGLDAYMLKDIGVSPAQAEHEANKPFWRE